MVDRFCQRWTKYRLENDIRPVVRSTDSKNGRPNFNLGMLSGPTFGPPMQKMVDRIPEMSHIEIFFRVRSSFLHSLSSCAKRWTIFLIVHRMSGPDYYTLVLLVHHFGGKNKMVNQTK